MIVRAINNPSTELVDWAVDLVEQNVRSYYEREWSKGRKRRELMTRGMTFLCATCAATSEEILGFAAILPDDEPYEGGTTRRVLYLYELQVKKEWQGKGIGRALLDAVCGFAGNNEIHWVDADSL